MLTITPLLADLIDVLKAIVPLVLLVIWVLSQVFGQKGPQPGQGKAPGGAAGGGAGNGGQAQGNLRQEIDRFLREAREQAERQEGQQRQGQQGQGQPNLPDPALEEKKRKQKQEKQKRKQDQQREAARQRAREMSEGGQRKQSRPEIIEDVQVIGPPLSVSQQVSTYMDTSAIAQSAARLGAEIGQTDERLATHLHQTFDHNLGQLGGSQTTEIDQGGASVVYSVVGGAQLAAQLANPRAFRNAVIMNEILTRPEHRWD